MTERHASLFRNGRNQAVRIPREFEQEGTEVLMRKEGDRLNLATVPVAAFQRGVGGLAACVVAGLGQAQSRLAGAGDAAVAAADKNGARHKGPLPAEEPNCIGEIVDARGGHRHQSSAGF